MEAEQVEAAQQAILDSIRRYVGVFNTLRLRDLKQFWDTGEPNPFYLAEELSPRHTWPEIDHYLDETMALTSRLRVRLLSEPEIFEFAPGVARAYYEMRATGVYANQPAIGTDVRVFQIWRSGAGGWRLISYVEAPMATITALRVLLRRNADPFEE